MRTDKNIILCDECKEEINEEGATLYVLEHKDEHFCSDKCLFSQHGPKEYLELYEKGEAYYTEYQEGI